MSNVTILPVAAAPAASSVPSFDFGDAFETRVAALIVRDERFGKESVSFVKPEHFNDAVERNLVALVQEFCTKFNTHPSIVTLLELVSNDKRIQKSEHHVYAAKVSALLALDMKERDYVRAKVVEFCKHQAMLLAAIQIPDLVKKGKFDEVQGLVSKANAIGKDNTLQFIDYYAEADKRKERRDAIAKGLVIPGINTGFPEIDGQLYRRGWGKGELTVIMAPSKRGKTAFMLQSALYSSLTYKTNWLYITLEVDEDILTDRADAALTATNIIDIVAQRDIVASRVAAYGNTTGKLWIERRPSNALTTDQVDQIVESYINAGNKIDALVVDYIGILRLKPHDDRFIGLGNAAKELRRIAGKYDIAVLTGAQTNRDAIGKQVSGMDAIGESFAIVQDCDLLLSINANDAEIAAGVRRIYFAASRNNQEVTIKIQGDMTKMQLIQTVLSIDH